MTSLKNFASSFKHQLEHTLTDLYDLAFLALKYALISQEMSR
jgi:hypothetical protein